MNRRKFLQLSAASSLFAAPTSIAQAPSAPRPKTQAKNVIFLVSDGMSMGTFTLTDQFLRWRDGRPSHWLQLYLDNRVRRGLMDMSSLNSIVTDSSAAASSWGCGARINNGAVNMGPKGEIYPPILSLAQAAGKATGLVTTATLTHATPAGFAANVPDRGQEEAIAQQYLEREFDLLLGGGRKFFEPESRKDKQDLLAGFTGKNYQLLSSRADLKSLPLSRQKAIGLFAGGHVPYELDRIHSAEKKETVPSLAEMTAAALQYFSRHPNGFIVQIEGARIDHAAHENDIGGLVSTRLLSTTPSRSLLNSRRITLTPWSSSRPITATPTPASIPEMMADAAISDD
jgi:alkaline phosphatase